MESAVFVAVSDCGGGEVMVSRGIWDISWEGSLSWWVGGFGGKSETADSSFTSGITGIGLAHVER